MIQLRSFLSLIFFIIAFTVNGQTDDKKPFFFIQLTDPQFGFIEENRSIEKESALYQKAVDAINHLKPAFVVITGDLVNDRNNAAQLNEFRRITALISKDIPVWYSPGNHDIGQSPTRKDIDEFVRMYGHDRFSFRYGSSLFIGLNSCVIKSAPNDFEEEQYLWLKDQLEMNKDALHKVIFTHYPFFLKEPQEKDEYFNIEVPVRNKYLALFNEYHADAVFSGHLHNNASAVYGNLVMTTTSAVGRPLADVPSGFRIVYVYPARIESTYYSLEKIPATVYMQER
jgi:3',5'-cyclic AMP phosphodiesterase CpdA